MTLNRTLLILSILILGTLAFLSFAPPQTGKWVYMWQGYLLERDVRVKPIHGWSDYVRKNGRFTTNNTYNYIVHRPTWYPYAPSKKYSGLWRDWDDQGNLRRIREYQDGKRTRAAIYSKEGALLAEVTYASGKFSGHCRAFDSSLPGYKSVSFVQGRRKGPELFHNADGVLEGILYWEDKNSEVIYDRESDLDRRTEFGIPLE